MGEREATRRNNVKCTRLINKRHILWGPSYSATVHFQKCKDDTLTIGVLVRRGGGAHSDDSVAVIVGAVGQDLADRVIGDGIDKLGVGLLALPPAGRLVGVCRLQNRHSLKLRDHTASIPCAGGGGHQRVSVVNLGHCRLSVNFCEWLSLSLE